MAFKDNLKFFSQMDGYVSVLTKADFDNNTDTIATKFDNTDTEISNINDEINTINNDITTINDEINTINSNVDKKLEAIIIVDSGSFKRYLESATVSTTDSTQTTILTIGSLPIKSVISIDTYSQNLQDDYATKWIFNGTIYATIKDDGTITVDKSLTDIVKDDSDWAFDIAGNNGDSDNASIDLKVTGKDSTNIKWSIFCDVKVNKF